MTGDLLDASTGVIMGIDYAHHEVHSGSHYTYSEFFSLGDGDEKELIIITPDTTKWAHMLFAVNGALHTTVKAFEDTTWASTGTDFSSLILNNNRNSDNTAGVTIRGKGATGTDANLIFSGQFGNDSGNGATRLVSGGSVRGDAEWVLKQNSKYLLTITSLSAANELALVLSWYEHRDKL